ncbi:MAG: GAF domain-containing protein [Bacteroidota bacterium]
MIIGKINLNSGKIRMRIGTKLLLWVLTTTAAIMLVIGLFISIRINSIARDNAVKIAQAEAQKSAFRLKSELDMDMGFSRALAHALYIYPKFDTITLDSIFFNILKNQVINNSRYLTVWYTIEYSAFRPGYTKDYGRRSVTAYLNNGQVGIDIEHKNITGDIVTSNYYASKTCNCEMLLDPYTFEYAGKEVLATSLSVPVRVGGRFAGLGGVDISLEKFQADIEKIKPYPGTNVSLIAGDGRIIADSNPQNAKEYVANIYPLLEAKFSLTQKVKDKQNHAFFSDTYGKEYLNILTVIQPGESPNSWGLILSIPMSEIVKDARKSVLSTIFVFIIGIILQAFAIWYISARISKPIKRTTDLLNSIAEGDIDVNKKIYLHTGDELEEMSKSANKLIDGLNHTEKFAREIGEGKLDIEFKLLSEKDKLGKALTEMQRSLIRAREQEEKRKEEEKQQIWATEGMALFGEVLRQHNDNINELSYLIIKNLVNYTGSIQGGVFILNENDPNNPVLEMTACYAYNRRKLMEKTVLPNEGLVGRCYVEKKTIFMVDVPRDYIKITSGLGEENPSCILIVPLIANDIVQGVIELATFNPYQKYQVDFIEKLAASIAATLASVKINMRTAQLLSQTQQQAEEMRAQEEEMRQNMEELHATQEEMERKRHEQEAIQAQLREDKSILESLLLNSSDLIFQKDADGRFRRVSQTMVDHLGLASADEAMGLSEFELMPEESARKLWDLTEDVSRKKSPVIDRKVTLTFADGQEVKGTISLYPIIADNGGLMGVLGIIRQK